MTAQLIPTSNDPFYTQTTTLDGVPFQLDFRFNQRESCWHFDILTQEGVLLTAGVKVVPNIPLLRKLATEGRPAGEIMALCTVPDDDSPPGIDELGEGSRVELYYLPLADLPPGYNDG